MINLYNTGYPVVEECARNVGFKVKLNDPYLQLNPYQQHDCNNNKHFESDDFDICWFDLAISSDVLFRIKSYQRIS